MNPFRIILLSLLSISLLLMLYVIFILVPERQAEYAQYQSTVQMTRYNELNEAHQARLEQIAPRTPSNQVETALNEVKESELKREAALADAEERRIIALARAKEEQAIAEAKKAEEEEQAKYKGIEVIGQIVSYDAEWASLVIIPREGAIVNDGLCVAVMQQEGIICEAIIDGKDEPSGQYIASMRLDNIGNKSPKSPQAGDKVIISPFESSADIRNATQDNSMPTTTPQALPDIDATLVPIP